MCITAFFAQHHKGLQHLTKRCRWSVTPAKNAECGLTFPWPHLSVVKQFSRYLWEEFFSFSLPWALRCSMKAVSCASPADRLKCLPVSLQSRILVEKEKKKKKEREKIGSCTRRCPWRRKEGHRGKRRNCWFCTVCVYVRLCPPVCLCMCVKSVGKIMQHIHHAAFYHRGFIGA